MSGQDHPARLCPASLPWSPTLEAAFPQRFLHSCSSRGKSCQHMQGQQPSSSGSRWRRSKPR
eukprot:1156724-Pelagomonas_calceolata.AAC.13